MDKATEKFVSIHGTILSDERWTEFPRDWCDPDWNDSRKTHNWHHYINDDLRALWWSFSFAQRRAISKNAQDIADQEDWE